MDEGQYRLVSNAEFAARIGITEEQLLGVGEYFKKNPPPLSSSIFTPADALPIDPTAIHGSMEIIEQLRNCEIKLEKANSDNQKITSELNSANEKIATLSKQLDDVKASGRFASVKNVLLTIIGGILLAIILWFIGQRLGIQL